MDAKWNTLFNVRLIQGQNDQIYKNWNSVSATLVNCLLSIRYGFGIICITKGMNATFKCNAVCMKIYLH